VVNRARPGVGAAWLKEQLIDYDVGSNYGNGLYLANVGANPRGLRQFNLKRQTQQHGPTVTFADRWGGHAELPVGLHTVDAADWLLL
tara:strand:- start:45298 stop:45558 length:261 start_codon:yes stop_codon:yes gene_type:complete